ncbi:MAG: hypothetical protein P8N41_04180 [Alphaproteobacteria bacterium]|nr:hypothetical protein [Alphaproteobacteria bacterium]
MDFNNFIAVDWSGDKSKFQKGISVAQCPMGRYAPKIIKPEDRYWSRSSLIKWLLKEVTEKKTLIGFDFSFAYPFYDCFSYFPGIKDSPISPYKLWKKIDNINNKLANFYGGGIWSEEPYSNYYNSPNLKGTLYKSRRRFTEIKAKNKIHSPSPTFNCVGPGAVGTGSLAGMRVLNFLKNKINIWPFNNSVLEKKSVAVEIFPSYYFRYASVKPEKNMGYALDKINQALSHYGCNSLPKDTIIGGPDQDDADAIVSAAAMRYFSNNRNCWNVPKVSKKEGWIFGVY